MSVHPLKRRVFVSLALVLCAAPLFALNPGARVEARMVYSPTMHRVILFGGASPVDRGTGLSYELNDTWERTASRWIQRFPAHSPSRRTAHAMVYDSARDRAVLFGGRAGTTSFNDTWVYSDGDWTKIETPNAPPVRFLPGAAYDSVRDRLVMFGGSVYAADLKTITNLNDTWEFDGTTWVQTNTNGPQLAKPILVYDAARAQTIMIGTDTKTAAVIMYGYDAADHSWKAITPTTLPDCANEASAVYNEATQKVFFTGGVCTNSSAIENNYEWDGTNWTKVQALTTVGRSFGSAIAYDTDRAQIVYFGGSTVAGVARSGTFIYADGVWVDVSGATVDPAPRSLFAFVTDVATSTIWLYGGIDDAQTFSDFWKFQNGQWEEQFTGTEPTCLYPVAVWDTDRSKIVMLCGDSTFYEFDGAAWKAVTPKNVPPIRHFSSMVYDQNLKKTVLFGGWDTNYLDQTWTYDGTDWTRVKKNLPPSRALAAMWYDPNLKKTVIYGGLGRVTSDGRLVRFDDMWTFDGTGWTQLTPAGGTPGARYGAQVTVDPRTNHVVLFGGLRLNTSDTGVQTQVYADDTWEWDGTAWKQLAPSVAPPARENAGLTFDPVRNELVMFSGFAGGTYATDTWGFTNGAWHQRIENALPKRRSVR